MWIWSGQKAAALKVGLTACNHPVRPVHPSGPNPIPGGGNIMMTMAGWKAQLQLHHSSPPLMVTIGEHFKAQYRCVTTTAPVDYDGFGTLSLSVDRTNARLVLIQEEHFDWQTFRYSACTYKVEACDKKRLPEVEDNLTRRFLEAK
jgi:hypothetical protein